MKKRCNMVVLFLLIAGSITPAMAQKEGDWNRFYIYSRRDEARLDTLPQIFENSIKWASGVTEEQQDVIRYILSNMSV